MPTVGQALQRIAELHSELALLQTLSTHIEINFVGSDMEPEHHVLREDGAFVPPEHVQHFLDQMEARVRDLRAELEQWENLQLPAPKSDAELEEEKDVQQAARASRLRKKKRASAVSGKGGMKQ
jgi:hypothetical protein